LLATRLSELLSFKGGSSAESLPEEKPSYGIESAAGEDSDLAVSVGFAAVNGEMGEEGGSRRGEEAWGSAQPCQQENLGTLCGPTYYF
jgi:hypothetical protein